METKRICQSCGQTLAADSPQGQCPECLMRAGFGTGVAPEPGAPTSQPPFTPPPVEEMTKLFPQLEIVELLGRGGMGAVYKARQPALDRWVALKILPPQSTSRPDFTERFNREARALARLNHPGIVAVHEFGQVSDMPFFVMEYVEGITLRRLVQERRLEPREALKIVPQICEALQFAHDEGVVHRDIKPENILLDKKGRVKIADFGIAKIVGGTGQPLTRPADTLSPSDGEREGVRGEGTLTQDRVLGTPHYMAPEQVEKPATVDHRADIYSLGVVFYELLTGELPLGKFQPPSKKVQVDVRLDEVVLHTLEKEPERRYQRASEVKTDVERITTNPAAPAESSGGPAAPLHRDVCFLSTPERMRNCFPSAAAQIFLCKGELQLTPEALTFVTPWQTRMVIPLPDIEDLSIGQFQMWTTPWVMQYERVNYLSVTFTTAGRREMVLLTPAPAGASSAQRINEQIGEWLNAIQDAVRARTGVAPHTSAPRAVSISAEPAWNRKGLPLCAALLVSGALVAWRPSSVFGAGVDPLWITLLVIMWGLLAALIWFAAGFLKANAALKRGNLDAVTSNEPPEAYLPAFSGPEAESGRAYESVAPGSTPPGNAGLSSGERARLALLERRSKVLLWYGFIVSLVGLPMGLALRLPVVWGLSIAGIVIGSYKLRLFARPNSVTNPRGDSQGESKPLANVSDRDANSAGGNLLVAGALAAVVVYAALVVGVAVIAAFPFGGRLNLPLVGVVVVSLPIIVILSFRWLGQTSPENRPGWLKAWAWVAWLLAVPVVGFGVFFLYALRTSTGGWNPAPDEAVLVPLTWLGSLLLPASGLVLSRAGGGSKRLLWWLGVGAAVLVIGALAGLQVRLAHLLGVSRSERAALDAKMGSTTAQRAFAPVVDRLVAGEGDANQRFIDFDTGKLFAATDFFDAKAELSPEETKAWWKKTGIDAVGDTSAAARGLMGFEMVAVPVPESEWARATPARLDCYFQVAKPGTPAMMSGKGSLPATFAIKTREGGTGLLQITGFSENPPGVEIRYKLVRPGLSQSAAGAAGATELKVAHDGSGTHTSIQAALDVAAAGVVVRVGPGHYDESLVINKPVTLIGAGWDQTVIGPATPWTEPPPGVQREAERRLRDAKTDEERQQLREEFAAKFAQPVLRIQGPIGDLAKAERYRLAVAECEALRRREQDLLMRFTREHPFIRRLHEQLQEAEARKRQLEQEIAAVPDTTLSGTMALPSTFAVQLSGLRFTQPGTAPEGRLLPASVIEIRDAGLLMRDCAILGSPGNGLTLADGASVIVDNTLVAAVWNTGIRVERGTRAQLTVTDSDIRNCHYAGIVIGHGQNNVEITRCRISGAAWHGVRYDDASPTLTDNLIFANARCGIYASGQTAAQVCGNVFWKNEMNGMSCWFENHDQITNNTFAANLREGLSVMGASEPVIAGNIFWRNPQGVQQSDIGSKSVTAKVATRLLFRDNLFWTNAINLASSFGRKDGDTNTLAKLSLADFPSNQEADPGFRNAAGGDFRLLPDGAAAAVGIGAADPLAVANPWPLQPEEEAIIPDVATRDSRQWKRPGAR